MQLWIDPLTNELRAWYSDVYNGTVHQELGYMPVNVPEQSEPIGLSVGAIIAIGEDGNIAVVVPAPPRILTTEEIRLRELQAELRQGSIRYPELVELFQLQHNGG